jgi:hypothetical protein
MDRDLLEIFHDLVPYFEQPRTTPMRQCTSDLSPPFLSFQVDPECLFYPAYIAGYGLVTYDCRSAIVQDALDSLVQRGDVDVL